MTYVAVPMELLERLISKGEYLSNFTWNWAWNGQVSLTDEDRPGYKALLVDYDMAVNELRMHLPNTTGGAYGHQSDIQLGK